MVIIFAFRRHEHLHGETRNAEDKRCRRLSRDGRWLAYYSRESGNFEVYVTPFPEGRPRWLIADGTDPTWGFDGTEVYYRSGARFMAARIDTAVGIRVLSHRLVIEPFLPPQYDDYDIHPDGRTLVMVRPAGSTQGVK